MMGWEGVFGVILTSFILFIAQFSSCPFGESQCVNGHIDDIGEAYEQLKNSKTVLFLSLAFIAAAAGFNGFGVTATKLTSGAQRTVVEQSRVILIWMFFLVFPGTGHETFSVFKLGGFFLIVLGVLFFNKVLEFVEFSIRFMPNNQDEAPSQHEYDHLANEEDLEEPVSD